MELLVSYHSNSVIQYSIELKKEKKHSVNQAFGELTNHKQPVRGVSMSANDSMFATNSFDSVKVWSVDLFMYSQKNQFDV